MSTSRDSREAEGGQGIQRVARHKSDAGSQRNPLAWAVVQALHALCEELDNLPDHRRVELRGCMRSLCATYNIPYASAPANASDISQDLADEDGDDIGDQDASR